MIPWVCSEDPGCGPLYAGDVFAIKMVSPILQLLVFVHMSLWVCFLILACRAGSGRFVSSSDVTIMKKSTASISTERDLLGQSKGEKDEPEQMLSLLPAGIELS